MLVTVIMSVIQYRKVHRINMSVPILSASTAAAAAAAIAL